MTPPRRGAGATIERPARRPAPEPARAGRPPTERRFRERRNAVARDAGRRRLAVLGTVLAVLALAVSAVAIVHTSLFAARHVVVSGERHTSAAAILAASGLDNAPPLIDVHTGQVAAAVERLPWVAHAAVQREWPETVRITVREAAPIAFAEVAGGTVLLDGRGRVLEALRAGSPPPAHLVPLGRLAAPAPGGTLPARELPVLAVAGALPLSTLAQLTALVHEPNLGVVGVLRSGAQVIFGSAAELPAKMVALVTLLKSTSIGKSARLDLRVPAAPVLTR
ncbi:MAG TPA: FtsQ-type POTRA domain-containing protein [Acidimicrobiales bacterium]|nr:FtsQ-type POTRA domain-containing protein [Acidimicrobiales bacterium]